MVAKLQHFITHFDGYFFDCYMGSTWSYDGHRPYIRGSGVVGIWIYTFVSQSFYIGSSPNASTVVALLGTLATALSLSELASM
jgi:hypothetical protein